MGYVPDFERDSGLTRGTGGGGTVAPPAAS